MTDFRVHLYHYEMKKAICLMMMAICWNCSIHTKMCS